MTLTAKEGHIASSFSIVEILMAIYRVCESNKNFTPQNIILSKGHASFAYYAFLHSISLMTNEELQSVGSFGSKYYGHLPYIPGDNRFQFGSGSLGHGLPYAVGLRYARHLQGCQDPVYCIIGDGEANEGTFWESLLFIQKLNFSNLAILVDANGSSERAIPIISNIKKMINIFHNIDFLESDGHDSKDIEMNLNSTDRCKVIICHTQKGFPIPFMIENPLWHHKIPTVDEAIQIEKYL